MVATIMKTVTVVHLLQDTVVLMDALVLVIGQVTEVLESVLATGLTVAQASTVAMVLVDGQTVTVLASTAAMVLAATVDSAAWEAETEAIALHSTVVAMVRVATAVCHVWGAEMAVVIRAADIKTQDNAFRRNTDYSYQKI